MRSGGGESDHHAIRKHVIGEGLFQVDGHRRVEAPLLRERCVEVVHPLDVAVRSEDAVDDARLEVECVCRSWRDIIADHEHRKKLPQTLSGFFYTSFSEERCPYTAHHITTVTEIGRPLISPTFSFLPQCKEVIPLDCCNGLLLCRCLQFDGVRLLASSTMPCATLRPMVPDANWAFGENRIACLCFDPAISSHFHVLDYVQDEAEEKKIAIT
ncbi:uncharacterized protein LOC127785902 [Oryza glaberrima]|uniref:uncharacterized protein LOC127785902 n=1 Tax=Oryza glaberrima TaxID=4538 RepID=UPI00023DBB75|nr:uncharacterized protein LOC127785902 [Oryza glaberrima]